MESTDEISLELETTVPTDLSLSPDEGKGLRSRGHEKRKLNRQIYEKKQLLHDIQVLKIELSQKSLLLDNMKAEYMQRVEDLEEKYGESQHQRQLLQTRLENELLIQREESKKRQNVVLQELELILKRQKQLEEANERLQERAIDIKKSLKDLDLTEGQYHELKGQHEDEMSLKHFVAVKKIKIEFLECFKAKSGIFIVLSVEIIRSCETMETGERATAISVQKHERRTAQVSDGTRQVHRCE